MKRVIRGKTPDDVIRGVFENEGWSFIEGESRTKKLLTKYDFSVDNRKNEYVATRKKS